MKERYGVDSMPETAENVATDWKIEREAQDRMALASQLKAVAAQRANFFDGEHFVLKGASPRTAGCFLRRSFRNWFQPHYQHVYATLRCVDDGRPA